MKEHGTYQTQAGQTVEYYKTSKGFVLVSASEITLGFNDCDSTCNVVSLEAGLKAIDWE